MDTKDTKARCVMRPNQTSYHVIGCALRVHTAVGPGVLEKAVAACMHHEMTEVGLHVQDQVPLPLVYKGVRLPLGYRVDFIIENCLVVEIKCVKKLLPIHRSQVLNYLKQSGFTLGLLLNFDVPHMKDGIHRVINGPESDL